MKRILIVGHGDCGKDEGLKYLASLTPLRNAGCTSWYLAPYVAAKLGIPVKEAYESRKFKRDLWYQVGRDLRENDQGILVREALQQGEMTGGVRDIEEVIAARENNLIDLIIWVDNNRVPPERTVKFGPEVADVIVENHGTMDEYRLRLRRLAQFAGLIRK